MTLDTGTADYEIEASKRQIENLEKLKAGFTKFFTREPITTDVIVRLNYPSGRYSFSSTYVGYTLAFYIQSKEVFNLNGNVNPDGWISIVSALFAGDYDYSNAYNRHTQLKSHSEVDPSVMSSVLFLKKYKSKDEIETFFNLVKGLNEFISGIDPISSTAEINTGICGFIQKFVKSQEIMIEAKRGK